MFKNYFKTALRNILKNNFFFNLILIAPLIFFKTTFCEAQIVNDPNPLNGVETILNAFTKYQIVALGDAHGCKEQYVFLNSLINNLGFAQTVNTIVVEFGNSLYQETIDKYLNGDSIANTELVKVWRNHTNILVFDSPVYQHFFEQVRKINLSLPKEEKIRILLGDPPIDWDKVQTNKDWGRMLFKRDVFVADVVEKEVYQKKLKAFLIIGSAHLIAQVNKDNVAAMLLSKHPASIFTVITHTGFFEKNDELEQKLAAWKFGSIALIKNTWLGVLPAYYRWPQLKNSKFIDTTIKRLPELEDVVSVWLFVGRRDLLTEALPWPGIYRDEYWNELNRRNKIMWGAPLLPDDFNSNINTNGRYYVP